MPYMSDSEQSDDEEYERVRNSPGYLEWLKKNGLLEFAKGKARWDDDDDADIDPFSMWGGA